MNVSDLVPSAPSICLNLSMYTCTCDFCSGLQWMIYGTLGNFRNPQYRQTYVRPKME